MKRNCSFVSFFIGVVTVINFMQPNQSFADYYVDRIENSQYGGNWNWVTTNVSTDAYISLAYTPCERSTRCGARLGGGVNKIYGIFTAGPTISNQTYTALACDSDLNTVWGIRPDGGIDRMWIKSEVGYVTTGITDEIYTAIVADSHGSNMLYGAQLGGGVDIIYGSPNQYGEIINWHIEPISTIARDMSYSSLALDAVSGGIYGLRSDGRIDQFSRTGTTTITSDTYTSIVCDGYYSNVLYGIRTDGRIDQIQNRDGQGWINTTITNKVYTTLCCDSDNSVYAAYVPEPATLLLLGVGGVLLRKRKAAKSIFH